eukprot:m.167883 g.167883  ORF g.167883 m.167883 type:complete len:315 (+) comp12891_c0_seq1:249-1193(+)
MRVPPQGPDYASAPASGAAAAGAYDTEYRRQYGNRNDYAGAAATVDTRRERGTGTTAGAGASRARSVDDDNKRKARREAAAAEGGGGHNSDDEVGDTDDGGAPARDFTDDATFVAALERSTGWKVHPMAKDGACLFRSVAFHLFGDPEMHGTVRDQCMDYMAQNRDHYEQFITENFDEYIARKRQDHCFGNHLEMQAMSELYNRNIEVYSYSLRPINIFQATTNSNEPIRVTYHGNIHYNAISDPNNPSFGVGLGFADLQPGAADRMQVEQAQAASEQELIERELIKSLQQQSEEEMLQEEILQQVMLDSLRTK